MLQSDTTPAPLAQVIQEELSRQDLTNVEYVVLYSGLMDYMPSSEVPTEDTEGMDSTSVEFYMYKTSESVELYDKNEPEFK